MFRLGYNTNGLAHHRPADALRLIAKLGYDSLAITPDPGCLDPFDMRPSDLNDVRRWAEDLGLAIVLETGSRFLLDAERKHFPTLLEDAPGDRARRIDFLKRCVDMASALDAEVLSIWSGAAPNGIVSDWPSPGRSDTTEVIWRRLVDGVGKLLHFASGATMRLAFEPEPGMFVATPKGFNELTQRLGQVGESLGLTLDVGHCLVTGDDVATTIKSWAPQLINVHLDDIKNRRHSHCMFGEGDLDLALTLRCLTDVGFAGVAAVELSRDSYRGPAAASEAMRHLRVALSQQGAV